MFIALVVLAHIYVDLIVSVTNVFLVFVSTINKHFILFLLLLNMSDRFPMAEQVGCGTLACYEVWVCGRSWVRAPAGEIVRRVFHPTVKVLYPTVKVFLF